MYLFDSVTKTKRPFIPLHEGKVSMYVCGPTVYDDAHLGHARSSVVFDLLRRVLMGSGYEVTYVKNITDIDDKILNKLSQTGQTLLELTSYYIERYNTEMEALNCLTPTQMPKATDHIDAMVHMIHTLIEKGFAYQSFDGTVYFDTTQDERYFSLSHRAIDESQTQSRLEEEHTKRHPNDFALWKPAKNSHEIAFDSALGRGRPGWHIECSAMIESTFGSQGEYAIDIHGGGADLLFPHHENEAAQSRCATGVELANFWVHNGFVTIGGEKMSKSLGNSFFLKDALEHYHGEVLRFYLLSTHYRSDLHFFEEDLLASKKRLDRLYRLKKRLYGMASTALETPFQVELLEALHDDMNTSKVFALIDAMLSHANDVLDNDPKNKAIKTQALANLAYIERVMGLGSLDAYAYFQFGFSSQEIEAIEALLAQRHEAKKAKDFATADALRQQLIERGIAIMDTVDGTKWERA
ncbi:MAG: cysteinyl-tRNA synthetase [Sulfuricurvum sp. PC08-66]|nr:MAG: cysteinyl-tRNA synthetase [Sulfuricurvum sp. PC08-66]